MGQTITTKPGDHWTIVGATGTGKTQFLLRMVNSLAAATAGCLPIYILDSKCPVKRPDKSDFKHLFTKNGHIGKRHTGQTIPPIIRPRGRDFIQVWTPLEDDLDLYDEWFKRIYQEGRPAAVIIDELSTIGYKGTRYYDILLKQGRGLEISMLSLTQSPSYIPPSLLRQAMHVVRFRLNDEYDAKKLQSSFGRKILEEPEHEHGFYYRNVQVPVRKSPPTYYKDAQEFFGI